MVELRGWKRVACGTAMLAMAGGSLVALAGLVVAGVRPDTVRGLLGFAAVFNLPLAALVAAVALLDSRRSSWSRSSEPDPHRGPALTLTGWIPRLLVVVVAWLLPPQGPPATNPIADRAFLSRQPFPPEARARPADRHQRVRVARGHGTA